MKKLLAVTLSLASLGFIGSTGMANVNETPGLSNTAIVANAAAPQVRIQIGRGRHYGRGRTVQRTRFVRYGRRTYRETYLVRFFPDGRTQTTLISRERVS